MLVVMIVVKICVAWGLLFFWASYAFFSGINLMANARYRYTVLNQMCIKRVAEMVNSRRLDLLSTALLLCLEDGSSWYVETAQFCEGVCPHCAIVAPVSPHRWAKRVWASTVSGENHCSRDRRTDEWFSCWGELYLFAISPSSFAHRIRAVASTTRNWNTSEKRESSNNYFMLYDNEPTKAAAIFLFNTLP